LGGEVAEGSLCCSSDEPVFRSRIRAFLDAWRVALSLILRAQSKLSLKYVWSVIRGSLGPDDEVDIDAGVNSEVGDLTDNVGRADDINHTLVDSHLITIPGVGTVTARRATGGDSEGLGGDADGTVGLVSLVLGAEHDLAACRFEGFDFATAEGHSDALVLFLNFLFFFFLLVVHIRAKANFSNK